jgi:isopenicillin N synthase-like dioxygenase
MSLPIIRLDDPDIDGVSEKLRVACIEYGFFYLGGHGITKDCIDTVFEQSKILFNCSTDNKVRLSDTATSRGYTAMEEETLDPIVQAKSGRGDTKEGYYIGRNYDKGSPDYNPAKLMVSNIWPTSDTCPDMTNPTKFQSVMEQYFTTISDVSLRTTQLIAKSLRLDDKHYFDEYFTQGMASIRLLHYSATTSNPDDGLLACGAHSDYGMLTLLITDGTPGLQILTKTNEWLSIPAIPPSIDTTTTASTDTNTDSEYYYVVNIGDMLERWTNGLYRSTIHRVVTDGTKERYSIPFFYEPNFDTIVQCIPSCCNDTDNLPRYPPVSSGQYLINKYTQTHADFEGVQDS